MKNRVLIVCTTDSMIWNFLIPHIKSLVSDGYYVECACSKTGFFYDRIIKDYGIILNRIDFDRSPYSIKNVRGYFKLIELIKNKKFDTVFCHEPVGGAIGRLAGHHCKCRVIYMAHGFHFYNGAPKFQRIYYWVEKFLAQFTDTLITINQEDYDASLNFKAKRKVKINGIGIDTSQFEHNPNPAYIRDELKIPRDGVVFLSVGELIERKNHEVVIRAFEKLAQKDYYYVIVGDGRLHDYLVDVINNHNLSDKVYLLGYREDINQLCNSADVFIMPSVQEGLSVALMEAMACGKPVIASKIRGNTDLIDETKGGFLVNVYDVDGYVTALKEIVNYKQDYGEYNRKKVLQYDISIITKNILDIFNL